MTGQRSTPARTWLTVPELAVYLRDLLASGDSDDALRFLLDGFNRFAELREAEDVEAFLAEPDTVGDLRWDTLLAASAAYVCRRAGVAPPRWSRRESLPQWWWPGHVYARRALVVQRTPIDFRRVGIWFDERNFTLA